jgi:methyltransferase
VRHPNYVAVILEMVCIPLVHGAYLTAIVFTVGNALLLLVRIRAEEAALGAEYERAFAHHPRFIPRGGHEPEQG